MLLGQVHAQGRLDLDSRPVAQGPCGSPGVLYQPGCPPDEKIPLLSCLACGFWEISGCIVQALTGAHGVAALQAHVAES